MMVWQNNCQWNNSEKVYQSQVKEIAKFLGKTFFKNTTKEESSIN